MRRIRSSPSLKPSQNPPKDKERPSEPGPTPVPMSLPTASASEAPPRCQQCAAHLSCVVGRLPRAQQERLDPLIQERAFRKGEPLQAENTAVDRVRTLKLGTVMVTRQGPDRVARPVAVVGRGHLLGLMALLGQTTQVAAQALSAGRYCELPAAALRHAFASDPALQDRLHHQVAVTLARMADWAHVMRLRGLPRQLVATLMLLAHEQGSRTVRLPSHVALAEVLRTSRESVARTLRQLEEQGHLQRHDRWHVTLAPGHTDVFTDIGPETP